MGPHPTRSAQGYCMLSNMTQTSTRSSFRKVGWRRPCLAPPCRASFSVLKLFLTNLWTSLFSWRQLSGHPRGQCAHPDQQPCRFEEAGGPAPGQDPQGKAGKCGCMNGQDHQYFTVHAYCTAYPCQGGGGSGKEGDFNAFFYTLVSRDTQVWM